MYKTHIIVKKTILIDPRKVPAIHAAYKNGEKVVFCNNIYGVRPNLILFDGKLGFRFDDRILFDKKIEYYQSKNQGLLVGSDGRRYQYAVVEKEE